MNNLEYLENLKKSDKEMEEVLEHVERTENFNIGDYYIPNRQTKALEIIAEALTKIDLTFNVLTAVVEVVTNQGRSVNVDARVSESK